MRSSGGAKAVIHVHQLAIRNGEDAIILRRRGKSHHFREVKVHGPVTIVQSSVPDHCGARVWIETWADVEGT